MRTLVHRYLAARRARTDIRDYLNVTDEPRLHLGCGAERFPGWLNADVNGAVYLDLTQPFPIPDRSIAFVYHEHVIEHLELAEARHMLTECFRVIRPSGVMRVSCPDFEMLARHYLETPSYYFESPIFQEAGYAPYRTALQRLSRLVYDFGHHWMWDFESLVQVLADVGFREIERREFGDSPHPALRSLDRERRRWQSMYIEARRP